MDKLVVRGTEINVQWDLKRDDFLSLTDIAKIKDSDNPRYIIQNWLRNRNAMNYAGNSNSVTLEVIMEAKKKKKKFKRFSFVY